MNKRFSYTQYTERAKALDAQLAEFAQGIEHVLDEMPNSREKSLALTKLEECAMWSSQALREVI